MSFEDFIVIYLIALTVFAILDAIWLSIIAKDLYAHYLKRKLAIPPHWPAAIAFYLLFIVGLVYFAIAPAVEANSPSEAAVGGALYGFFTYITYTLTNLATLKGWPQKLVAIDIAWGTVAGFTTAILTYVIF